MATVRITCPTPGAVIRYTLDGSDPNENSSVYTSDLEVDTSTGSKTVKAKGYKDGLLVSDTTSMFFESTVPVPTLTLSRSGGVVTGIIGNLDSSMTYYYKIGSAPISSSDSGAVAISGTSFSLETTDAVTIYVRGFNGSVMTEAVSDSVEEIVLPVVSIPVITQNDNTVTFTCSTPGATIHYSGCGKSGTCSSGGSVSIVQSGTMTAYATNDGYQQSSIASRSCTYTPTCSTPSINFNSSTNTVTITCSTSGSTIYYRVGSSGSYKVYSGSFTISSSTYVYAYATKSGYYQSDTTSRYCTYIYPYEVGDTVTLDGIECVIIYKADTEQGWGKYICIDKNHDLSYYISGSDYDEEYESDTLISESGKYGYEWGGLGIDTGIDYEDIGKGLSNTNALIALNLKPETPNWRVLWDMVKQFRITYGNDWFVPSLGEMAWVQNSLTGLNNVTTGTTNNRLYWCSDEVSDTSATTSKGLLNMFISSDRNNHETRARLCRYATDADLN